MSEVPSSEARLARRLAAGDRRAWGEFLDAYGSLLQEAADSLFRKGPCAAGWGGTRDDLVQEIWRHLLERRGLFGRFLGGGDRFRAWVWRVALYHGMHAMRAGFRRDPGRALREGRLRHAEGMEGPADPTGEDAGRLREALASLSEEPARAVRLYYLEGRPYTEAVGTRDR